MQLKHVGRILAALGGLLLVSSVLTWMIGAESFVKLKLVTAMAFFAFCARQRVMVPVPQ